MFVISKFKLLIAAAVLASVVFATNAGAEQITVHFRSGTSLTGTVVEPEITWTTIAPNGAVSYRNYSINQIASLKFSESESSAQLVMVRQLVNRLGDSDFHQRESAEQTLMEIGGQYRSVIESLADHPSYEVRHRLQRLFKAFKETESVPRDLDVLKLKNGGSFEGEASEFTLNFEAYGKKFILNRSSVAKLTAGNPAAISPVDDAAKPVNVKLFHRFKDFNSPEQKELRFDLQADGKPFPLKTKLNDVFVSDGLRMRSKLPGYVGSSPFSFKYPDLPVGGLSVGLLGQERGRDYKGVMEITFCEPGNANVPAGVHEFGTFIAKVSSRRDIIMEAYDSQGQLLATVEATDQRCVFAGVKSNQLITKLVILSNPYLEKLERVIDIDFAIDTMRFSKPIPARVFSPETSRLVLMENGDRLDWAGMNMTGDDQLQLAIDKIGPEQTKLSVPLKDVRSLALGRSSKSSNQWQALLEDGSRINVRPGKTFRSDQFGLSLDAKDFVAVWPAATPPRLPETGDFKGGSPVIVFPTCRLRTKTVTFSSDRLSWKVAEKLQQPLQLGDRDSDDDPTPSQTAFKYADTLANQLPTIWNKPPNVLAEGKSFIYLVDGQRLAIGDAGDFKIKTIDQRSVKVTRQEGKPIEIPLENVHTIHFK